MPHYFGVDANADSCWQRFLETPLLTQDERARLLAAGFRPEQCSDYSQVVLDDINLSRWQRIKAHCAAELSMPWRFNAYRAPVSLVHLGDDAYSKLLAECADAPPVLFCVGDHSLLARPGVAVVGSRRPSRDGALAAYTLGRDLALSGVVTISGLARGIDGQAHEGALSAGGSTIAVMATGIDQIYPHQHQGLVQKIASDGLLVTEFLPSAKPHRWHFPRRNHTLSGMALATVVVEAGKPSGSLITASAAADQSRDVFAYPWSVYHKGGEGCRYLLADGAQLAQSASDVVASLGIAAQAALDQSSASCKNFATEKADCSPITNNNEQALTIVEIIGDGALELPDLLELSEMNGVDLRRELSRLELIGAIENTPQGFRLNRAQSTYNPC